MIGLPANTPIYLCTTAVDFRKGFDGLTGIVTNSLGHNVTDGALFLFVNKALWWETGGLTLWYRRLEQGTVELTTRRQIQSIRSSWLLKGSPAKQVGPHSHRVPGRRSSPSRSACTASKSVAEWPTASVSAAPAAGNSASGHTRRHGCFWCTVTLSSWRAAAGFTLSHPGPRGDWLGVRTFIFHAGLFRGYINSQVIATAIAPNNE